MRHSYNLFSLFVCFGLLYPALSQNVPGWTLDAPADSVQLISAEPDPMFTGVLKFTFKNVSGKTIINFLVDNLHGDATGFDGFVGDLGSVGPGQTTAAHFGARDFEEQSAKKLRVVAIVYADGSRGGAPDWLERVENQMLGAALETRRIADILAASPDPSLAGFDRVAPQIDISVPPGDSDAVDGIHGIALPGVSVDEINRHLIHSVRGISSGIHRARQRALGEIKNIRENDARAMSRNIPAAQEYALQKRPHALSDMAKKYASLSEAQSRYIHALWEFRGSTSPGP